jgi:hypothetical protein
MSEEGKQMPPKSSTNNLHSRRGSSPRDNDPSSAADRGDVATDADLDRLESITGGADDPVEPRGNLARDFNRLDASTEEEIDALEVNLMQDGDDLRDSQDGTGYIVDDLARDQIEGLTEVGPELADKGVESVAPGRTDTSATLRRHHGNTGIARAEEMDNMDEPRDETISDRKVDKGTAA